MQLINVQFSFEGLVELSKTDVIYLLDKYIAAHKGDDYYPQTIEDCIENLCDDGFFDIDTGIINMTSTLKGCDTDFWKDIK